MSALHPLHMWYRVYVSFVLLTTYPEMSQKKKTHLDAREYSIKIQVRFAN
jgi:hypothetical protein